MNFAEVRKIKGQREGQWPAKMDMFATFTEIGGLESKDKFINGKPAGETTFSKCKLTDDMNETHLVTLYVKQAIPGNMLNQRAPFRIYAFDGTYGAGNPYEGYAGLWQDRPQGSPQTPPQPHQATNTPPGGISHALGLCDQLRAAIAGLGGQPNPNYDDNGPPPTDDDVPF